MENIQNIDPSEPEELLEDKIRVADSVLVMRNDVSVPTDALPLLLAYPTVNKGLLMASEAADRHEAAKWLGEVAQTPGAAKLIKDFIHGNATSYDVVRLVEEIHAGESQPPMPKSWSILMKPDLSGNKPELPQGDSRLSKVDAVIEKEATIAFKAEEDELVDYSQTKKPAGILVLGQEKLLTNEEEYSLGMTIQAGLRAQRFIDALSVGEVIVENPEQASQELQVIAQKGNVAKDRFVKANVLLAMKMAHRRRVDGIDLEDIQQEAMMGVMRAAEGFDPTMGYKFSTYASWWIRQAIDRAVYDQARTIRLPINVEQATITIRTAEEKLRRIDPDATATIDYLLRETMLDERLVRRALKARDTTSREKRLQEPIKGFEGMTLQDQLASEIVHHDESVATSRAREELLHQMSAVLSEREMGVIIKCYGFDGSAEGDYSLREYAKSLNVAYETAIYYRNRAVEKLRNASFREQLHELLRD